jgi:hypothetical protein
MFEEIRIIKKYKKGVRKLDNTETIEYLITYPKDQSIKINILYHLRNNKIELEKVTGIIKIPKEKEAELVELLEGKGALVKKVTNGVHKPIENPKIHEKYVILNRIFEKAITEKNMDVIRFLKSNLTKEEIKFLGSE